MAVLEQIERLRDNVSSALSAIGRKGVEIPDNVNSDSLESLIDQIQDIGSIQVQEKEIDPSEFEQHVNPDEGYYAFSSVTVSAISSDYIGSSVPKKTNTDLTVNGATVTVPAGYYSASASKSVASGSAGTPSASKGTVSNNQVTVTPSVTNTTGYITGGTKTGTAVTVKASDLVSGSQTITSNGTVDVTNLASVNVSLSFQTIHLGSSDPSSSLGSNGDLYIKL